MHVDNEIRQAIDACRPEGEDLTQPELRGLAEQLRDDPGVPLLLERSQNFDARVSVAFPEVAVPEDLAQRILATLGVQASTSTAQHDDTIARETIPMPVRPVLATPSPARVPRRRVLSPTWIATAAAIIVIAAVVTQGLSLRRSATIEQLADTWLVEISADWKPLSTAPPEYELPGAITANALGWQQFGAFGRPQVVAFRLLRGELRGTLFVARTSRDDMPTAPPARPQFSTGGRCVGAWQSGGNLYVLVVEGDDSRYRSFLKSTQPLA